MFGLSFSTLFLILIFWTIFSIVPTLFILRTHKHFKGTPEQQKKYDAFVRTDVDKWNYGIGIIIQFFTFVPRFILTYLIFIFSVLSIWILLLGSKVGETPLLNWRLQLLRKTLSLSARFCLLVTGVVNIKYNYRKDVSYKEFLGEDKEPTFDGAGIQISNHQCWIDIILLISESCPSFVAKEGVKKYPVVGEGARYLGCLFLKRGDTKEKRIQTLEAIKERQALGEKGDAQILHVFPEGGNTNGTKLINFKKGAFDSLKSIKPMIINYSTPSWGISPAQDIIGTAKNGIIISLCGYICASIEILPVFTPNDYFWKHHQVTGEEKWQTYARVIRQIMAKEGKMGLSDLNIEDREKLKKELKNQKKDQSE